MKRMTILPAIALLCSACAGTGDVKLVSPEEREWLLSGEVLDGRPMDKATLPEERILYLTPEMRRFARHAVSGYGGRERITALVSALIDKAGLALRYDSQATFTAEEVYRTGRANCLSFTHLFIAMARYLDMDAQYNEVDVPPIWDMRRGNTLVLNKHINAMVTRQQRFRHVIDLNAEEYEAHYEQRNIHDSLAVAQHYNNKAMAYLVDKDFERALRYLVKAISMDPGVSYLWNNLGSLYRRAGRSNAAELAYKVALSENQEDLVAMSNVARLYRDAGELALAAHYEARAEAYRMKNPYYLYNLARQAIMEKDYKTAMKYTREAIKRNDREHRFYFLLGIILQRSGDEVEAYAHFNRALELSSDKAQQARYRLKMDRLSAVNT